MVDGKKSESLKVDSGVPQGTVLGPLIFLLIINYLPDIVIHLFADDCLVCRVIRTVLDEIILQNDFGCF